MKQIFLKFGPGIHRSWYECALVLFCGLFLSGCGTTTIRESHLMATQDNQGNISYYRLTLAGDANMAKTTYRAGLYDAEALDALMGETSSELDGGDTSSQAITRLRKQAINQIGGEYYAALAQTNQSQAQISDLAARLGQAFASPYDVAANATPQGLIKPQRKFAVIFSANASIVEEAIADMVEAKETQDTVNSAIAGIKRDDFIASSVQKQQVDNNKSILKKVGADATALGAAPAVSAPPTPAYTAYPDEVKQLLETVANLSN
ncbi:MAG: hypothetical protein P4N60_10160 [Verrucomicrobiae bacterium]|nr:hypothetical protein [Verrucomicrobiae bacterium]